MSETDRREFATSVRSIVDGVHRFYREVLQLNAELAQHLQSDPDSLRRLTTLARPFPNLTRLTIEDTYRTVYGPPEMSSDGEDEVDIAEEDSDGDAPSTAEEAAQERKLIRVPMGSSLLAVLIAVRGSLGDEAFEPYVRIGVLTDVKINAASRAHALLETRKGMLRKVPRVLKGAQAGQRIELPVKALNLRMKGRRPNFTAELSSMIEEPLFQLNSAASVRQFAESAKSAWRKCRTSASESAH